MQNCSIKKQVNTRFCSTTRNNNNIHNNNNNRDIANGLQWFLNNVINENLEFAKKSNLIHQIPEDLELFNQFDHYI